MFQEQTNERKNIREKFHRAHREIKNTEALEKNRKKKLTLITSNIYTQKKALSLYIYTT